MSSGQRRLLLIAAVLAAIQFIVLPLLAYQTEQIESLTLVERRLGRSENLVAQLDVLQLQATKLNESAQNEFDKFPSAANATVFRLEVQDQIQRTVTAAGGQVSLFSWIAQPSASSSEMIVQQARLTIDGTFSSIATAQLDLTEKLPFVRFIDAQLRPSSRTAVANQAASLILIIEVAGRPGGQ